MMKSIRYQQTAVSELVEKSVKLLNAAGSRRKLIFKAPTGAGKTVMVSEMLSRLVVELPDRTDSIFSGAAFIWIAPNKLHEQSYFKMKNYFTESRELQPLIYDELDHSIDGYIRPGEILFVNWESINKENSIMVRETERSSSLYDITYRTQVDNRIPIVVIIDEEHMFGGRNAVKSERVLEHISPKLEIRISATPITSGDEQVTIFREDVIREEMIKEGVVLNPALGSVDSKGLTSNQWLVKEALKKRVELAKAYERLGVKINPLLLIQLPNDTTESITAEEETIKEEVISFLDEKYTINNANGKLSIWLSNEKANLEQIEKNDNLAEVLLFKQAVALGWDCPRAAVLLIFRKLESFTFTIQTIGRILRMPEQRFYTDPILNKGYVYTDLSKDKIEIVADDMDYISKVSAKLRDGVENLSLKSAYIERKGTDRMRLGVGFKKILREKLAESWTLLYQPDLFSFFGSEDESASEADNTMQIAQNRERASQFIRFDVRNITIEIPKDLPIVDELGVIRVDSSVRHAKTISELNRVFDDFCLRLLSGWEKHQSLATLKNALIEALDQLFGLEETDAKKVILYHKNQPKFKDLIPKALKAYESQMVMRRRASERDRIFYDWQLPEIRTYNENTHVADPMVKHHALLPYFRMKTAKLPELRFEAFLERHAEYVDWWYKNGDNGIANFAIPYVNVKGEQSLFYVDFIVRMKNGESLLFDTKTEGSDENAVCKHNALIDYVENLTGVEGGVLIEANGNWKYSDHKIENTSDITEWKSFFPDQYR